MKMFARCWVHGHRSEGYMLCADHRGLSAKTTFHSSPQVYTPNDQCKSSFHQAHSFAAPQADRIHTLKALSIAGPTQSLSYLLPMGGTSRTTSRHPVFSLSALSDLRTPASFHIRLRKFASIYPGESDNLNVSGRAGLPCARPPLA